MPTGARPVRDFLRLLRQRYANVEVLIYPVKVQGVEAAGEIARALEELPAYPGVEVIVLARGGGSLEDLWPFNEEKVACAIHRRPHPGGLRRWAMKWTSPSPISWRTRWPPPPSSAAVELGAPDKGALARGIWTVWQALCGLHLKAAPGGRPGGKST